MTSRSIIPILLVLLTAPGCTGPVVVRSQVSGGYVRAQGHSRAENAKVLAELRIFGTIDANSVQFQEEAPQELKIDYQSDQTIVRWLVAGDRIGKWNKAPYFVLGLSKDRPFKIRVDCQTKSSVLIEFMSLPPIRP
ncbi:MAG: hypothetical protein U0P46_10285 [Holophagaceae bacterium]